MSETDHYKLMLRQLNLLHELAGEGATENMDAIFSDIDWKTVADELEPRGTLGTSGSSLDITVAVLQRTNGNSKT